MFNKIKNFLVVLVVLVVAAVAAWNVNFNSQKSNFSDTMLANVEALAEENGSNWGCDGNGTWIPNEALRDKTCIIFISSKRICQSQENICCDPAQQVSCSGSKLW